MNRLLLTSMALAAVWPALASAQSQVIDSARMFSPEAVRSAEGAFKAFHERTNAEIVVETVSTIGKVSAGADKLPEFEQDKILKNAVESRAKSKGVRGIYILVCQQPAKLKWVSSRNMIDDRDAGSIADAMVVALKKGDRDGALAGATGLLGAVQPKPAAAQNQRPQQAKEGGGTASMLWTLLFIAIGVWVVMALFRAMSGGGAGGGGFFQSMLGGLFGAAAGMWLYNSFSNSGAFGGGTGDSGYDSGGGDFGDTGSGGGDWGGGGDFGGSGDF